MPKRLTGLREGSATISRRESVVGRGLGEERWRGSMRMRCLASCCQDSGASACVDLVETLKADSHLFSERRSTRYGVSPPCGEVACVRPNRLGACLVLRFLGV